MEDAEKIIQRARDAASEAEVAATEAEGAAEEAREAANAAQAVMEKLGKQAPADGIPMCLRDLLRDPGDRLALARTRDWVAECDARKG